MAEIVQPADSFDPSGVVTSLDALTGDIELTSSENTITIVDSPGTIDLIVNRSQPFTWGGDHRWEGKAWTVAASRDISFAPNGAIPISIHKNAVQATPVLFYDNTDANYTGLQGPVLGSGNNPIFRLPTDFPLATGGFWFSDPTGITAFQGISVDGVTITGDGTPSNPLVATGGGGSGITIGTTTITSGTNTRVLFDNAGVVGEYTISGSGNVAMTTSPVFTTPNIGSATGSISGNAGTATAWATARNLASNSVDGTANVAFANKFIVQGTTDAGLSAAQFLGALGTGLVKNTTTTGVLSIAVANTDYTPAVMTTGGDIIYGGASGVATRLANGSAGQVLQSNGTTLAPTWVTPVAGTVTSVSFTGGLITVATATTTPAFTVAGTSGGIPYFSSTSTWASSALLAANAIMIGGGAGTAPATTTTGTGVLTALGVNVGSAGAFVTFNGALGTPSSATLTNATGLVSFIVANEATDTTCFPLFATAATGELGPKSNASLTFNSNTGALGATSFVGAGTSLTGIPYSLTGTANQVILSAATGNITFSLPQSIATSSNPQFATIELGAASDTTLARVSAGVVSIEGVTIATSSNTLTLTNKSIVASQITTGTFGTGAYTMDTSLTVPQIINTSNAITASGNAATVPITSRISTVTNNSAATLTITITTTSAVDGQQVMVRILDFSAVAQTLTFVNTENSQTSVPTTSNGSTTLPLTVGFQFNSLTSKWRCLAVS